MIQVFRQGNEQQPVVVIDDFDPDPELLIETAAEQTFRKTDRLFPGVRAPVGADLMRAMRARAADVVGEVFGVGPELNRMEAFYSLVTTPPEQLEPMQRLPHFDGFGVKALAMILHLSRAELGGTAFFRHRTTGFESMSPQRFPAYRAAVNAEISRDALPRAYVTADNPWYEQIGHYPARFNRLLIYPGAVLHSGHIPEALALTDDPRTGRFSVNSFLWGETPTPAAI